MWLSYPEATASGSVNIFLRIQKSWISMPTLFRYGRKIPSSKRPADISFEISRHIWYSKHETFTSNEFFFRGSMLKNIRSLDFKMELIWQRVGPTFWNYKTWRGFKIISHKIISHLAGTQYLEFFQLAQGFPELSLNRWEIFLGTKRWCRCSARR